MSTSMETTDRFLRRPELPRIRRNHRRVQVQRILLAFRHLVVVLTIVVAGSWIYQQTQTGARFGVQHIEIHGAVHTAKADIDRIVEQYIGLNLFQIDIARVQSDLRALPWIRRIEIEKKIPDTLRIRVTERQPVALLQTGSSLRYVDDAGNAFAELSPKAGNDELPLIIEAEGAELDRCLELLQELRLTDPLLFSRVSHVRPVAPAGFAIFDRELQTTVISNRGELRTKWPLLLAIARSERFATAGIAYADLRFNDQIVVKPKDPTQVIRTAGAVPVGMEITN